MCFHKVSLLTRTSCAQRSAHACADRIWTSSALLRADELRRRLADVGDRAGVGEPQYAWDRRVYRNRLARGAPIGEYFESQISMFLACRDRDFDELTEEHLFRWREPTEAEREQRCRAMAEAQVAMLGNSPPADHASRCRTCGNICPLWGSQFNHCEYCMALSDCGCDDRDCSSCRKCRKCPTRRSKGLVNCMPNSHELCFECMELEWMKVIPPDWESRDEAIRLQAHRELEHKGGAASRPSAWPAAALSKREDCHDAIRRLLLEPEPAGFEYAAPVHDCDDQFAHTCMLRGEDPEAAYERWAAEVTWAAEDAHANVPAGSSSCSALRTAHARTVGLPPRRKHYGSDLAFRTSRADWYKRLTGQSLKDSGSLSDQWREFDTVTRAWRAYSDGRRSLGAPSDAAAASPWEGDCHRGEGFGERWQSGA